MSSGLEASKKSDPASEWVVIVPSVSVIPEPVRGLHAGSDGVVTVESENGRVATFSMTAGSLMPIRPRKVTASTVSPLVGVW